MTIGVLRPLQVVAALIEDDQGRWLLAQRRAGQHLAGCWEFPGGKKEPDESGFAALRRELHEELGIEIDCAAALMTVIEPRPTGDLHLQAWRVLSYHGTAQAREQQTIRWLRPDDWPLTELAPADLPIAQALALGTRYLITPDAAALEESALLTGIKAACDEGIRLIRLRCADRLHRLPVELLRSCEALIERHGGRLVVDLADFPNCQAPSSAIHLRSAELATLTDRPCGPETLLLASCHDARELLHAERLGVDITVLSPIAPTRSHPGVPTLGWDGLRTLIEATRLPAFALGGMQIDHLEQALRAGALGIAGISGLWRMPSA